jgi:hypothetical protein
MEEAEASDYPGLVSPRRDQMTRRQRKTGSGAITTEHRGFLKPAHAGFAPLNASSALTYLREGGVPDLYGGGRGERPRLGKAVVRGSTRHPIPPT